MRKTLIYSWAVLTALLFTWTVSADHHKEGENEHKRQKSPKGANVYIVSPRDGEIVGKKFKVIFGLQGMGICPAGITAGGVPIPDTGHHHLLIDVKKMPALDKPLPSENPKRIQHFGGGQTETTLELEPGKHTLQLVFADYAHVAHDPPVISKKITVKVKE